MTIRLRLKRLAQNGVGGAGVPFAMAVAPFVFTFAGPGYSLFPDLALDEITIRDAFAATEPLQFLLWGIVITLPVILGYTLFAYRVFWGKTQGLSYD